MLAWRVTLKSVETKWMSSIVFAVICKAKIQIKVTQASGLADFSSVCLMCDLTSLKSNPHKHESSHSRFWFRPLLHYHLCGFPPGTPVSFHSPKTWKDWLETLNLSVLVNVWWWPVQGSHPVIAGIHSSSEKMDRRLNKSSLCILDGSRIWDHWWVSKNDNCEHVFNVLRASFSTGKSK